MRTSKDYGISERLDELIQELEISNSEFAKNIGVTRAAVGQWVRGISAPSETTVREICRQYNVDYNWLKYGKFEMFLSAPKGFAEQLQQKFDLSTDEVAFVLTFLESDKPTRSSLIKFNNQLIININKLK